MGSVELLKSYISLRKFETDNIFFKNSQNSIFRAVFESATNASVFITSYYMVTVILIGPYQQDIRCESSPTELQSPAEMQSLDYI